MFPDPSAMNPSKMVELQHQIRNNNQDLSKYLTDLGNWTETIKTADKSTKAAPASKASLPPIRNKIDIQHKAAAKKETKGDMPVVNSPEEAAQLPPGTQFRDPQGNIRVAQ